VGDYSTPPKNRKREEVELIGNYSKYLMLLIPIAILQLVLMVVALIDIARREQTNGPKWIWVLVVVFGEILGSVIYFIFGRKE
jgi:hypothetical protein